MRLSRAQAASFSAGGRIGLQHADELLLLAGLGRAGRFRKSEQKDGERQGQDEKVLHVRGVWLSALEIANRIS